VRLSRSNAWLISKPTLPANSHNLCALTADAGMDRSAGPLRLAVRELTWHREPDANAIVIGFRLTRGSFATTVLRELIDSDPLGEEDQEGG